jgi:riboflavin kinase/FMN adenylyltransferase
LKKISYFDAHKYAAALGLFDGVHLGHRAVFCDTVKAAEEKNLIPAAITFSGLPKTQTEGFERLILTETEKRAKMSEAGLKAYLPFRFEDIKDLTAREFAALLTTKYGISYLICGEDFRFGAGKSGDVDTLRKLSKEFCFGFRITPEKLSGGVKISSGEIKKLLRKGDVKSANALLGYDFYYNTIVIEGSKLGRELGFPTINQIIPESQIAPRYGVYLSKTEFDGKAYKSLSNIGMKPTVAYDGKPLNETYIEGFDGDLYGRKIKVSLQGFIRSERQFAGLPELKSQLENDKLKLNLQ